MLHSAVLGPRKQIGSVEDLSLRNWMWISFRRRRSLMDTSDWRLEEMVSHRIHLHASARDMRTNGTWKERWHWCLMSTWKRLLHAKC